MAVPPKKTVTFFAQEDLSFLMDIFSFLDREEKGHTIAEDAHDAFAMFQGLETTPEDFAELLAQFDLKGSDQINWPKFLEIIKKAMSLPNLKESVATKAFKELDPEDTGYVTADQMNTLLFNNGENMPQNEVDELLRLAPKDEHGNINHKEFRKNFVVIAWLPKTNTSWKNDSL